MVLQPLPRAQCLRLLTVPKNIKQVKQIHAQMITNNLLHKSKAVANLMAAYVSPQETCFSRESLLLYTEQIRTGVVPNKIASICVLRACARSMALKEGVQVHARLVRTGFLSDVAVQTTGIHFYGNCGDIKSACKVFDEMCERSCVTWNAMLSACCANFRATKALELFGLMRREGLKLTERTAVLLLSACAQLGKLGVGRAMHVIIWKGVADFYGDVFVGTGLVDMYCKCGSLSSAHKVFEKMSERNVLTWTVMMAGLAMHGKGQEALSMLEAMQEDAVVPNAVTFVCLLVACCHAGLVEEGLRLFELMRVRYGVEPRVQHYCCIVDLLGRAGMVREASDFIKGMPVEPDAALWRAMLAACKMHGYVELAEEVARKLLQMEHTSLSIDACEDFVALSNLYASAERWNDVWMVREEMKIMGIQNKPGCSSVQVHILESAELLFC